MFRSLTDALNRREQDLVARSSVGTVVQRVIREYIRENYPDTSNVSVRYDPRERGVVILTPSKALAGELVLNTREIRAHLALKSVRVGRIIIR